MSSYPKRGEVWIIDLGMSAKIRPCLVVNVPFEDSERALITVVPHTTAIRHTRFEHATDLRFLKEGAFDAQGIVTVPAIKALRKLGNLSAEQLSHVDAAIRLWLGLT